MVKATTLFDGVCLWQQVLKTGVEWMFSVPQLSTLCNHYIDVIDIVIIASSARQLLAHQTVTYHSMK